MPNARIVRGNRVRSYIEFSDLTGSYIDPPLLRFKIQTPDNVSKTWTYGTDAEVVKDSVGHYHADVSLGTLKVDAKYICRWEAFDPTWNEDDCLAARETVIETVSDYKEIQS